MKFLITTTLFLISSSCFAQSADEPGTASGSFFIPLEKTIFYKLGDKQIPIRIQQYGNATDIVFINLHANEITSVQAAQLILESKGGTLLRIDNGNQRVIRFRLQGITYAVDPNRVFSHAGIEQNLKETRRTSEAAIDEIEKFAQRILQLISENTSCIVALHNNTNEYYSIKTYLPGNERQGDARTVYANPEQDPDDIAFTTDSILYQRMADLRYNSIWQDNEKVKKDGSLSVWCGEKGRRYINIETEHGKLRQYTAMLTSLLEILSGENK